MPESNACKRIKFVCPQNMNETRQKIAELSNFEVIIYLSEIFCCFENDPRPKWPIISDSSRNSSNVLIKLSVAAYSTDYRSSIFFFSHKQMRRQHFKIVIVRR